MEDCVQAFEAMQKRRDEILSGIAKRHQELDEVINKVSKDPSIRKTKNDENIKSINSLLEELRKVR